MGHILIFLHKIAGLKLAVVLLAVTTVAIVFPLSSVFKAHALNVHTEIKANPAGIARIIDRTGEPPSGIVNPRGNAPTPFTTGSNGNFSGNPPQGDPDSNPPDENGSTPPNQNQSTPPNRTWFLPPGIADIFGLKGGGPKGGAPTGVPPPGLLNPRSNRPTTLIINTDIEFGTVFPGETQDGEFTVSLSDTQNPPQVEYHLILTLTTEFGYLDLTNYLTVVRDTSETDVDADLPFQNNGSSLGGDLQGNGGTDISDRWEVTLTLPDDPPEGDYWTVITVWVDFPVVEPDPPPTQEP